MGFVCCLEFVYGVLLCCKDVVLGFRRDRMSFFFLGGWGCFIFFVDIVDFEMLFVDGFFCIWFILGIG